MLGVGFQLVTQIVTSVENQTSLWDILRQAKGGTNMVLRIPLTINLRITGTNSEDLCRSGAILAHLLPVRVVSLFQKFSHVKL